VVAVVTKEAEDEDEQKDVDEEAEVDEEEENVEEEDEKDVVLGCSFPIVVWLETSVLFLLSGFTLFGVRRKVCTVKIF
jgi:hypothetical protein